MITNAFLFLSKYFRLTTIIKHTKLGYLRQRVRVAQSKFYILCFEDCFKSVLCLFVFFFFSTFRCPCVFDLCVFITLSIGDFLWLSHFLEFLGDVVCCQWDNYQTEYKWRRIKNWNFIVRPSIIRKSHTV